MIPFLRDKIIVNHSIKEIKRTKEYRVELAKFNVSKHLIFEEFSNINTQNISVKEDLIESINLIKQSHYIKAKSLLDGLEANFIEKNTLEYGIYLKYLANTYYQHGMINKAASFSVKSIEILQFHLSEFNTLLIETKLEYNEIRNQLTNNFQNLKNSILKCLINSIIINDKKMIVYSYMCLGNAYKVCGQLHKSGFYCKLSHKLFKKYKLKDDNFELKVLLNILKTNSNYNAFSKLYMKGKFKKLEKYRKKGEWKPEPYSNAPMLNSDYDTIFDHHRNYSIWKEMKKKSFWIGKYYEFKHKVKMAIMLK
jgi:tetratricopeptide (TPR) repeat protein